VPVEPASIEKEPHRRFDDQLSDVQRRSCRLYCGQPPFDRRGRGALDRESVERADAVLEDEPFAAGDTGPEKLIARAELERMDLSEVSADGRVAAYLQVETVDRSSERESSPVDGRRTRGEDFVGAYASAFCLIASNSAWLIAPLSSSAFARSISAAAPPPLPAVERT
jgi:hypothetical protein